MNDMIETARAMIDLVCRSAWRDVYVRTAAGELFIAKLGGAPNPMRGGARARPAAASSPAGDPVVLAPIAMTAPHIASFVSSMAIGDRIEAGDAACRIAVLDEVFDVRSPTSGTVASILAGPSQLVEFGAPLMTVQPN